MVFNNAESDDLPASRLDKQWKTWYRCNHGMISMKVTVQYVFLVVSLCVSVGLLCILHTNSYSMMRVR